MLLNKLALGTAQFGYNYGVVNTNGKIDFNEQNSIIRYAENIGIGTIDTAIGYKDSEKNLGLLGVNNFKIVTKIPPLPKTSKKIDQWLNEEFKKSINRLNVNSIYALLLHKSEDILNYNGKVLEYLEGIKKLGYVKKIGVSIYSPKELDNIINKINIDIVQTPLNIIDNRILKTGWLKKLKKKKIEIHARSVFLQGLLLTPRKKIPKKFEIWNDIWNKWHAWQKKFPDLSSMETCIGYVNSIKEINKIIIGVDNLKQLKEIAKTNFRKKINYPDISSNDEKLIYPFNWKSL